jgi:sugar (pentulose or hexulose) kinase
MALLAVDIGTTNCKVGVFRETGRLIKVYRTATNEAEVGTNDSREIDPELLYSILISLLKNGIERAGEPITCIAITGMAEACLVVSKRDGRPFTPILPWADTRPKAIFEQNRMNIDEWIRFKKTGLHNHMKWGCYKLGYLAEEYDFNRSDALLLSVSDYLAYRLTGVAATDASLAARTYCYDITTESWDREFLDQLNLGWINLPKVFQSGERIGRVLPNTDLHTNAEVSICGHDHLCASYALEGIGNTQVLNSLGTAETISGTYPRKEFDKEAYNSGFLFGRKVGKRDFFWMGSIAASGMSVSWAKRTFGQSPILSYPTGILYFPYLAGSNPPHTAYDTKAMVMGLESRHSNADLYCAVLEGICYEFRWIYELAKSQFALKEDPLLVSAGGGADLAFMQLKANITGLTLHIHQMQEATMLGAIELLGVKGRLDKPVSTVMPQSGVQEQYEKMYREKYPPVLKLIHEYYEMRKL